MENQTSIVSQSSLEQFLAGATLKADENPAVVYITSLESPASRTAMLSSLNMIARMLTADKEDATSFRWAALRFQHTSAIKADLVNHYKPASANRHLAALKGVLKAAYNLGQMTPEEYRSATNFKKMRNDVLPAGRELAAPEIIDVVDACKADETPSGVRDLAIFAVLYICGLRRSELVRLELADFIPSERKINVLHGKGRKQRSVYLEAGALAALEAWVEIRRYEPGPLFLPINKSGVITHRALTSQSVYLILERRAKEAGVDRFSPHDLRRTFVSQLLDRKVDIATVSKMAGHSSVSVTEKYDRRGEEAKRKAVQVLSFPK